MFSKLYFGELKKLLRPKTIIALAIVLTAFLIIYAISYNFMVDGGTTEDPPQEVPQADQPEGIDEDILYGGVYNAKVYTEAEMSELIANAESSLRAAKELRDNSENFYRWSYDPVYEKEGYLTALEHIRDNEIYGEEVEIYAQMSIFSSKSAEGFMQGFFSIFLSILIIYAIIIGAGSFAGEMKNGTLKMLFMRPITRNKLTTAKLLSLLTMVAVLLLGGVLLSYLYGLIRFGAAESGKVLIVFNSMKAFMGTKSLVMFLQIAFGLIQIFAFVIFAFALGTITKNKVLSTIIGLIVGLGLLSAILTLLKMGRFLFSTASDLGVYFGVTSVVPAGGDFFIAFPLLIGYLALFVLSTYIIFNKRDIA